MLWQAFLELLNWSVLVASLSGIALGIVIGSIPGLGPTMAIALMIPVTFAMQPIPAILLLLGIYQGAIFGGSISAILLNVPGTPSSAATALDGFPMAQRGEAMKALKLALYASMFGNLVSCLFLIGLAQPLAQFALDFGPVELALLMLFALTVIVLFGGGSRLDALIMTLIGACIGVVGLDPIEGSPRFTFGSFNAESGFQLIPVLVGLFALSEVLTHVFAGPSSTANAEPVALKPHRWSWLAFWRMRATLCWSSLIGTFVGILPGIGSTVPAFVSYNLARSRSQHPERFGQGEPEGIAAPEAANNAVTGGALIPTLALGIPGDAVTAVILGAFMLKGLTPGPFLFRDHSLEMYAIFEALMLSVVPTVVMALLFFKFAAQVIRIKPAYLFPSITVLAVVGAYAVNNSYFDVGVMVGAGVLGFWLRQSRMPLPPLLIGLILGAPFEQSVRQSLMMGDDGMGVFVQSAISKGLLAMIVLSFAVVAFMGLRSARKAGA
jgi:putative tricarboxylic transport membrane protein